MVSNARDDLPEPDRPVHDHQLVARDFNIDVFQIVLTGTFYFDDVFHSCFFYLVLFFLQRLDLVAQWAAISNSSIFAASFI